MATGQVSSISKDNWQLISTFNVATTAQTQAVATSISGYKTLMLAVNGWTTSASANLGIYFNGDITGGNYGSSVWGGGTGGGADAYIRLSYFTTTDPGPGYVLISDASNTTVPKRTSSVGSERWGTVANGFWNNTAAITSITAYATTGTITAGTFKLYGLAE